MRPYIRPATVWAFAAGLTIGSLGIAAAATFGTAGATHLPDCQTPAVHYAVTR